jgi:hypothetical protein
MWLAPPIAALAVALVLSRFQAGAEAGGKTAPPVAGACGASPIAKDATGKPKRDVGPGSWWKLTERLDGAGAMAGRQLAVGRGGSTALLLDLATETVASGPIGGVVVVASDDERRSEISLVSSLGACSWLVDQSADVVRGAILDPGDGSVLAHLVDRQTRADLGTWRFNGKDALAQPALVAPALAPGAIDGPVWITDLRLDQAGHILAVQSCTDSGCLTRLFDLRVPGKDPTVLAGGQGSLLGFAGKRLLTWAACPGFPCGIQSWDIATARATVVLDRADAAAVTPDGRFVVASTDVGAVHTLRIELGSGTRALIKGISGDDLLLPVGVAATSGVQLGADEIPVGAPGANPHAFRPAAAEVIQ